MTICIGAIAEDKYVVLTADRTLTYGSKPPEFGHEHSSKLYNISKNCIIGIAGSPVPVPDFLRIVKSGRQWKSTTKLVKDMVDAIQKIRREKFEQGFLQQFGMSFDKFEEIYQSGAIMAGHARRILEEMENYHLCLHIVAGSVIGSEASLHMIDDPGQSNCCNALGFVATGSGEGYAFQSFLRANYTSDTSLMDAIYSVYEAKKNAEQAIGVGRRTDIRIITGKNSITLSDKDISKLNLIYDEKQEDLKKYGDTLSKKLKGWKPRSLKNL